MSLYTCYHSNQGWGWFFFLLSINNLEACIFHRAGQYVKTLMMLMGVQVRDSGEIWRCRSVSWTETFKLGSNDGSNRWKALPWSPHIQIRMKETTTCSLPKDMNTHDLLSLWCFGSLLSLLMCTNCLRGPPCFPNIKTDVVIILVKLRQSIPFANYSAAAYLIQLTISSGCPLSSPVPQWHVVLQQHDRDFRAQRIMAPSYPRESELRYPFPALYWVKL